MKKKYLYLALACWVIALYILFFFTACSSQRPFPEGVQTQTPSGYIQHCKDYPDSVFCKGLNNGR
jgi:hypothetical protein